MTKDEEIAPVTKRRIVSVSLRPKEFADIARATGDQSLSRFMHDAALDAATGEGHIRSLVLTHSGNMEVVLR